MTYKNRYNSNIFPPAPYAKVTVVHPTNSNQSVDDDALVDSGASGSLISKWIAERLMLVPNNIVPVRDFQGNVVGNKPTFQVKINIGTFSFSIIVAETDGKTIIGRDIMNQLTTILKGRARELEMM